MNPVPYPIIDAEFERRLFDADLIAHLRYERTEAANEVFSFQPYDSESYRKFKESYREECRAKPWDALSFAEQISIQLAFVAPMPRFNATAEEREAENVRYERYVRRITAEAEVIALWNSL